jgi:hypothetical protein
VVNGHQHAEETKGSSNAADREYAAAPVSQTVFRDERQVSEHDLFIVGYEAAR